MTGDIDSDVPFTIFGDLYWERDSNISGDSKDEIEKKGTIDSRDDSKKVKSTKEKNKIGVFEPFKESLELYNEIKKLPKPANIMKSVFDFTSKKTRDCLSDYQEFLSSRKIDVHQLATLAWNGIPPELRLKIWCILLDVEQNDKKRIESYLELLKKDFPDGYKDVMSIPENEADATKDDIEKTDEAL